MKKDCARKLRETTGRTLQPHFQPRDPSRVASEQTGDTGSASHQAGDRSVLGLSLKCCLCVIAWDFSRRRLQGPKRLRKMFLALPNPLWKTSGGLRTIGRIRAEGLEFRQCPCFVSAMLALLVHAHWGNKAVVHGADRY